MTKIVNIPRAPRVLRTVSLGTEPESLPWLYDHTPGTAVEYTYLEPESEQEIDFFLYLPATYDPSDRTRRYRLRFFLHGTDSSPTIVQGTVVTWLETAIAAEQADPDEIWVFPNGQAKGWYQDNFLGTAKVYTQILGLRLHVLEHTPSVEEPTALMGFSMGGYGVLVLKARDPDIWGAVMCYAAARTRWNVNNWTEAERLDLWNLVDASGAAVSPEALWEGNFETIDAAGYALRIVVGTADTGLINGIRQFRDQVLTPLGVDFEYAETASPHTLDNVANTGYLELDGPGYGFAFLADNDP
jgi:enterochelin esterase-like enzyme